MSRSQTPPITPSDAGLDRRQLLSAAAGLGAGLFDSVEDAASARPDAELLTPTKDSRMRETAYARWLDAVPRVRS